jgi:hypothetical protein
VEDDTLFLLPATNTEASVTATSSAARIYYEACVGRWRAPIQITITDASALRSSGMSFVNRLSLRALSAWPRWLGGVYLDTTVACRDGAEVVHTTVVRWFGIPLQRSTETFSLDPEGRSFTVRGGMSGSGSVDASSTRAEYELRWLGVSIRQHTVREPDLITVHQEGPGFRGVQELVRQS